MLKVNDALRMMIGSVFVIAAILKLFSIDEFEIYIYSFDIFSFLVTTFVSRLLIAGEFILGLLLILKINYKFTSRATVIILILFTLFLVYTAIFRNDDNCYCFGEFVELNPLESIIKNVILIALLLFVSRRDDGTTRQRVCCSLLIVTSTLLIVFIISPPDVIYNKIYSSEKEISSGKFYESFDDVVKINFENDSVSFDSTSVFKLEEGSQMIVIASSGCKYCRLGLKKLSMMKEKEEYDVENVDVFIWGSPNGIVNFRKETFTEDYNYWHIMPNEAIDITYGRFPIFILMEGNEIVEVGDFRSL